MVYASVVAALLTLAARAAEPQRWKGEVKLPGQPLGFVVTITPAGGGEGGGGGGEAPTAKLDIPMQGLKQGELKDVAIAGQTIRFTLALPNMPPAAYAVFEVETAADGQTAKGTLKQSGMTFPVEMSRLKDGEQAGPDRPQNPKPPFPYTQRELEVTTPDGAHLPGTLTIPAAADFGPGPHPAVLLITGSGVQDRDETLLGHKPFLVLADHLTRRGYAVLRVDDRGWAGHADPLGKEATTKTYADDALAVLSVLKAQPEADPKRLGLIGHSEGGLIAPMVAVRSPDVAFIVMLAGTGVPGREVLREQSTALLRAEGMPPALLEQRAKEQQSLFDLMDRGATLAELRAHIRALGRQQLGLKDDDQETPEQAKQLDQIAQTQAASVDSPWMRTFLTLDPRDALRQVRVPVLALNGSLDMQVLPNQNLPEIEKALKAAGNTDFTIRVLEGLNHLFQPAKTGAGSEYAQITTTFDPAALNAVTDWLSTRFPPGKPATKTAPPAGGDQPAQAPAKSPG
jgi:pimeloyl-ACP methyl ester carboxylesterase